MGRLQDNDEWVTSVPVRLLGGSGGFDLTFQIGGLVFALSFFAARQHTSATCLLLGPLPAPSQNTITNHSLGIDNLSKCCSSPE